MATKESKTVRINGTLHKIPEIDFRFVKMFEKDTGVALMSLAPNRKDVKIALCATACVMLVFNCGEDEATEIIEHHLEGGGDTMSLVEAFALAMGDSEYFRKGLVNQAGPEKAGKKASESLSN